MTVAKVVSLRQVDAEPPRAIEVSETMTMKLTRRELIAAAALLVTAAPRRNAFAATLPREVDVAIVGAGAAGIAAARKVAAAGRSVLMLEASAQLGGRHLAGDILCLTAALAYTFYLAIMERVRAGMTAWPALAASSTLSAITLLPFAYLAQANFWPHDWTPLLCLALSSQILGQGLTITALPYLSPLAIGLLTAVPNLFAVIGMILISRNSDRHRERRWHVALPALFGALGLFFSAVWSGNTVLAIPALTVANIGDEAQYFDGSSQKLHDSAGRAFSADTAAAIYLDESNSFLNQINPGLTVEGIVVFDVPADATLTTAELHDSAFSGGVTVALG